MALQAGEKQHVYGNPGPTINMKQRKVIATGYQNVCYLPTSVLTSALPQSPIPG